jgi:hypothetical protein
MSKKEVLINYGNSKFRLVRSEQIFQISDDGEELPRNDNYILHLGNHTVRAYQDYQRGYKNKETWNAKKYRESRGLKDEEAGEPEELENSHAKNGVSTRALSETEKEALADSAYFRAKLREVEKERDSYKALAESLSLELDKVKRRVDVAEKKLGIESSPGEEPSLANTEKTREPGASSAAPADEQTKTTENRSHESQSIHTEAEREPDRPKIKKGDEVLVRTDDGKEVKGTAASDEVDVGGKKRIFVTKDGLTTDHPIESVRLTNRPQTRPVAEAPTMPATEETVIKYEGPIDKSRLRKRRVYDQSESKWDRLKFWRPRRYEYVDPQTDELVEYEEKRPNTAMAIGATAVAAFIFGALFWELADGDADGPSQKATIERQDGTVATLKQKIVTLRGKNINLNNELRALRADERAENGGSLEGEPENSGQSEPEKEESTGNSQGGTGQAQGKAHTHIATTNMENGRRYVQAILPNNLTETGANDGIRIIDKNSGNVVADHVNYKGNGAFDNATLSQLHSAGYTTRIVRNPIFDTDGGPGPTGLVTGRWASEVLPKNNR